MTSANGRFVIVYNGECYNFHELRDELGAAGHSFRGHSDTEVVLEGCAEWGVEATVRRMVGMFAFALWDRMERRLWLVRDRLGIKPLYSGIVGDFFLFGSELKALRVKDGWTPEIDRDALTAFLRFNYVPAPQSIYRGIGKLEPGCLVEYATGGAPQVTRYWDMAEVASQAQRGIGEAEALREGEALLAAAVRRRLVADVPQIGREAGRERGGEDG